MLQIQEFEKILNETSEKVNDNEFEKVESSLAALQAIPIIDKKEIASLNETYEGLKKLEKFKKTMCLLWNSSWQHTDLRRNRSRIRGKNGSQPY